MSTFKKLVLILSSSFMGLQSDAMWLRRPLMVALAKRQTAIRIPIKAAIRTQSVPAKRVVRYVQPRRSFTFKSNKLFNTPRAISFKRLVATSVALGTLCATTRCEGSKTEAEHPIAQYQAPFEESRKKFYQDLESKPWGEVSKKYIKALQEEEQKLMDELCSILKMDANEFKYIINHLLPMFLQPQYRKAEFEDEGGINFLKQRNQKLPQNLVNQMNSLLMQCSIDPQKIILLENNWNNCSDASASQSSIKIAGKLVGAFDEKRYPHYQFTYAPSMPIGIFAHEIQHILHNDVVARLCVNLSPYYLKKNESGKFFYEFIDMKTHKAFQKKYCKFTEKRADLMAGLVAPECALGLAKFHAKSNHILMRTALWLDSTWLGQLFEEDPCPEHPIPSERAAYMTRLHTEMLAAIVKK